MKPYYEHDGITIYNADCREVLPTIAPGSIDLVLTDPPYGIGEARGKNKSRCNKGIAKDYGGASWDDQTPPRWLFDWIIESAKHSIIFGGNYFGLPPSSCWLVWDKDNGQADFADCELAWTNLSKAVRRIRWRWNGMLQENMSDKEPRFHPTQKPVVVMKWCIGHAPETKTILDPFMGSGTTLRAAKDSGISAIGIEREEKYCEIAAKRLEQGVFDFQEETPAEEAASRG